MVVRNRELDPHDGGFDSADHQEHQGINDVQDAEPLVIDGRDPLMHAVEQRLGAFARGRNRHWFQNRFGIRHQ